MNFLPFHRSTRKIFDKISNQRKRVIKDFTKPKNISVNNKLQKMINLRSLKETLKTGTIEKLNKEDNISVSNASSLKPSAKTDKNYSPNIYSNKEIIKINKTKNSKLAKTKSRRNGRSATKDKKRNNSKIKLEKENYPRKSLFEDFHPNEPQGNFIIFCN